MQLCCHQRTNIINCCQGEHCRTRKPHFCPPGGDPPPGNRHQHARCSFGDRLVNLCNISAKSVQQFETDIRTANVISPHYHGGDKAVSYHIQDNINKNDAFASKDGQICRSFYDHSKRNVKWSDVRRCWAVKRQCQWGRWGWTRQLSWTSSRSTLLDVHGRGQRERGIEHIQHAGGNAAAVHVTVSLSDLHCITLAWLTCTVARRRHIAIYILFLKLSSHTDRQTAR